MNYDKKYEEVVKINKKYLVEFEKWLKEQKLSEKTIRNHVNNVDLYINDYLNYYDFNEMKQGCYDIDGFLGDWFIRKCMWSTAYSVKTNAASIKKFYCCMSELGYVEQEDYKYLCKKIKDDMEIWIEEVEEYNTYDDDFDVLDFI